MGSPEIFQVLVGDECGESARDNIKLRPKSSRDSEVPLGHGAHGAFGAFVLSRQLEELVPRCQTTTGCQRKMNVEGF